MGVTRNGDSIKPNNEEHGGGATAYGKDYPSVASLEIAEHGGHVRVEGKDFNSKASIGVIEDGGRVEVHGKDKGVAAMGINRIRQR